MNKCPNPSYDLKCPYALSESSPVPCFASQKQCNEWRLCKKVVLDINPEVE